MELSLTATSVQPYRSGIHPFHGLLLSGVFPLFLGAALGDYAYATSYQIFWSHLASWLIAGALVFNGLALVCALIGLVRTDHRAPYAVYFLLLLVTWVIGFCNTLIHARDAWAVMPTGLVLSIIVAVLACAATLLGFARFGAGGRS